ncbi:similar to glycoside hydrolase family 95 protein [Aspergillus luchuensis]|uniref:Similar to glycoside hydrolase family 95 protein n=1 Tax=Aspergillus kawachii TaxID=1069201 RepID=A0A146FBM3_ASPKA|nr:similar to glycoside hydrolase family 95 protein [Aspergillus luchuensis]
MTKYYQVKPKVAQGVLSTINFNEILHSRCKRDNTSPDAIRTHAPCTFATYELYERFNARKLFDSCLGGHIFRVWIVRYLMRPKAPRLQPEISEARRVQHVNKLSPRVTPGAWATFANRVFPPSPEDENNVSCNAMNTTEYSQGFPVVVKFSAGHLFKSNSSQSRQSVQ